MRFSIRSGIENRSCRAGIIVNISALIVIAAHCNPQAIAQQTLRSKTDSYSHSSPTAHSVTVESIEVIRNGKSLIRTSPAMYGVDRSAPQILRVRSPKPFRSAGVWWKPAVDNDNTSLTADATSIMRSGRRDRSYPVIESDDLSPEDAGPTGPAGALNVSSLIHVYDEPGRALELRIENIDQIESLHVVFIPWSIVNEIDPKRRPPLLYPPGTVFPAGYPKPPVSSRASWGADPPQCNPGYCNTTHIGVHHTAGASEYYASNWSESAANVRAIQAYHMYTRGWCDIGYNYLIDVHGYIFEGRGGGDNIIGAHDGYNCGSMGVSFMGYFHPPYNQALTQTMIDSLAELGAWKCDQQGIDPWGTSWYSGYGGNMANIYGHRDVGQTACPGDGGYAKLGQIRNEIADRLNGGGGREIILDNPTATFTQDWAIAVGGNQTYGNDYRWRSTGIATGFGFWRPSIPQARYYSVQFWWTSGSNRNPSTTLGIRLSGRTHTVRVNQQTGGGQWNEIGIAHLPSGTKALIGVSSAGPGGYVVVTDAVRLVEIN